MIRACMFVLAAVLAVGPAFAQDAQLNIPYEKFVLPNGLTVLVHEDRKAPIVAVNVWYHVGSKNEARGRTGFAHLFEHLMFNGTEHFNQDYFKVLEKLGATDLNGTTNFDRTNYFQNVPTAALDTVLWMESDRMGHLLGVIDQGRLDEQRGVVQNEKRQGENQPYGQVFPLLFENAFPAGHPYSWPVIGSMEDLNAASLKDVREWFQKYYGPSNAVIVLAGDIDLKTAREKIEKNFGHIAPGSPLPRHREWIAKRSGHKRLVLEDRVPQSRIYRVWNIPPGDRLEADQLELLADILGGGKTSRLYKRLVYTDQSATDVNAFVYGLEIAGLFAVQATARPGGDLGAVERAIDEELRKLLAEGPTADEVKRAQTQFYSGLVRGAERIGGFGGKSDLLAQGQVYSNDPAAWKTALKNKQSASAADLKRLGNEWLSDGVLELEVRPFPALKQVQPTSNVDRSKVPEPGPISDARFPKLERATLSNGLKVIVAERHDTPVVSVALTVDAGYAADMGHASGTAKLAMAVLDEGTTSRNSLQIAEELETLGARLNTGSNVDSSFVTASALKANLDASIALWADIILNPSFPMTDFERERKLQIASVQREKVSPITMALRVLPAFIYGEGHAYGSPFTGSGNEKSVAAITRDDVVAFHGTWFKPNNATVVAVGDTTMAELKPKLEKLFAGWKSGAVPKKNLSQVSHQEKPRVFLMDRPGSQQSTVLVAHIAPPRANPDEISFETLNTVVGGAFTSRINMNLREDKHWTYGAGSFLAGARGQRMYITYSPVQTDKTKESIAEINKELHEVLRERPVTAQELSSAQKYQTLSLPGSRETRGAVLGNILDLIQYNLPDDYFDTYAAKVRGLSQRDMSTAAERLIHPGKTTWVIIGDRSKVEAGIRELGIADVQIIDADGRVIGQ